MDFKDYLSNIDNVSEKEFAESFYNKFDRLNSLYDTLNNHVLSANGMYNSKICFIFKDNIEFKNNTEFLKKILNVYETKISDLLVLFLNKTDDYSVNIHTLAEEIKIINPSVIYIFGIDNLENDLLKVQSLNNLSGRKVVNISNLEVLLKQNISTEIFDKFKYLITYGYY